MIDDILEMLLRRINNLNVKCNMQLLICLQFFLFKKIQTRSVSFDIKYNTNIICQIHYNFIKIKQEKIILTKAIT